MNFRNAVFNRFGTIDCEIEHPKYGWIPFTASPDDVEPLGVEIYNQAILGPVAPYVPPPPPDFNVIDEEELNKALMSEGSVVRALALIMFSEINKLRVKTGDSPYTLLQFKNALKAQMR